MTREIFVFGSNLAGNHGGGSAKHAHEAHGAEWGVGIGSTGDSYAIPTLDANLQKLPLSEIAGHVADFIEYARLNKDWKFGIVAIGCGIARFKPDEIATMFKSAPSNCILPQEFMPFI